MKCILTLLDSEESRKKYRLLFFTISIAFFFTSCQQHTDIPQYLLGKWETSSAKYKDRYISFSEGLLIFGLGNGKESVNYIEGIESDEQEDNHILYSFHYMNIDSDEEEKLTLKFIYSPDSEGMIKLQNRDEIWKKVK